MPPVLFNHTFGQPAYDLACDEALLDACDATEAPEILRFWQPKDHFVVLGYGNKVSTEVDVVACEKLRIPILRRCSGGGTVLQGPGILNYSLISRLEARPEFQDITQTNCFIMRKHAEAIGQLMGQNVTVSGHTDLAVGKLKFSGNAQRRKQHALLFHGTFLLQPVQPNLDLMEQVLRHPSREPEYRSGRGHRRFLTGLSSTVDDIKQCLQKVWKVEETMEEAPTERVEKLFEEKYGKMDWNLRS